MSQPPYIVGLGGTARDGSTSELALRVALDHAATLGCETDLFAGRTLPAEIYDPSQTVRTEQARRFVAALQRADGVLIASPAYHGGISGLVKNALDFVEDLAQDKRVYLDGRAVGLVVCAHGTQAMGSTLASLRAIVHSLRGWPTPYGATVISTERPFDSLRDDNEAVIACRLVAAQVVEFARMKLGKAKG